MTKVVGEISRKNVLEKGDNHGTLKKKRLITKM